MGQATIRLYNLSGSGIHFQKLTQDVAIESVEVSVTGKHIRISRWYMSLLLLSLSYCSF